MASAFSHIAVPIAIRLGKGRRSIPWRLLAFAMFASAAPDLDSIGFKFGVPYESQWGHRGFTHSILFAALFAFLPTLNERYFKSSRSAIFLATFVSMVSHGVLDALTTGGLGVAFFWPFDNDRYFFPWRVIEVSPIGIHEFFAERGLAVIRSEFIYVWIPCVLIGVLAARILNSLDKGSPRSEP